MGVEQHDAREALTKPRDLVRERLVIGIEGEQHPLGDLCVVGRIAMPIERLAVESRGWAELGRRLAGIERGAGGITIDIDDRARDRRANDRRVERVDEVVELVEPPVGVLLREPRVDETLFVCAEIYARVGNADNQRRCAAPDHKPAGTLTSLRGLDARQQRFARRFDDGAFAHEIDRRLYLRMEIAIVVEMRNFCAEDALAPPRAARSTEGARESRSLERPPGARCRRWRRRSRPSARAAARRARPSTRGPPGWPRSESNRRSRDRRAACFRKRAPPPSPAGS